MVFKNLIAGFTPARLCEVVQGNGNMGASVFVWNAFEEFDMRGGSLASCQALQTNDDYSHSSSLFAVSLEVKEL